jgi:hypothetical protein
MAPITGCVSCAATGCITGKTLSLVPAATSHRYNPELSLLLEDDLSAYVCCFIHLSTLSGYVDD